MFNKQNMLKKQENIEFQINIGEYKVVLSTPKETRVCELLSIVRSYETLHSNYGPQNAYFIGLASNEGREIIDYWMTQPSNNFVKFNSSKLVLKALYATQKKVEHLTVNQFQFLKCLGEGACGSVYLVRSRVTGYLFALKRLKKQSIRSDQDFKSVFREQKILRTLPTNNHTVKFHASFQSMDHFNLLLQFYPGGELFVHLNRNRICSQKQLKMYFCEVLMAIQFLHKNNILYRDLKPQNIFVDINGHLFIGDFGLSKCGFKQDDNAYSHCGSPDYMAPQIMQNKQYNFCSDFYSIGAILHEFVTGLPPYYENGHNNMDEDDYEQKLSKIKKMGLKLDDYTKDSHLKMLIKGLLHPNPDLRISNFQQIKKSPWLADVDWKKIQEKSREMCFSPNVYEQYINQQFLDQQQFVNQMNKFQCEKFESFQFFDYVRPESEKIVLGRSKTQLRQTHNIIKKKTHLLKQKSTKNLNNKSVSQKQYSNINKGNISIALYEKHAHREQRGDTASTSNSNVSCYEPKTTKNIDNKQNSGFRKQGSKKNLLKKVPSCAKIQTNAVSNVPSHNTSECSTKKIASSKQKNGGLTLKTRNTEMLKSRGTLTPVHKSKSKQKSSQFLGLNKQKIQPYQSIKKKEMLPVSSYKIKLM